MAVVVKFLMALNSIMNGYRLELFIVVRVKCIKQNKLVSN